MNSKLAIILCCSYLLGTLPFSIIFSHLLGHPNPRQHGSGNPGASNVLRLGGKLPGTLTALGDIGKGWLPIFIAASLHVPNYIIGWVGLCALLGHCFPFYLNFKGGKGVATAVGCLLGLSWQIGCTIIVIWLISVWLTRYAVIASLATATLAPLMCWWKLPDTVPAVLCISILIWLKHWPNIVRLYHGEERKMRS